MATAPTMSALCGQQLGSQYSSLSGSALQLRCRQPRVRARGGFRTPSVCAWLHGFTVSGLKVANVRFLLLPSPSNGLCVGPACLQPAHPRRDDRAFFCWPLPPPPSPARSLPLPPSRICTSLRIAYNAHICSELCPTRCDGPRVGHGNPADSLRTLPSMSHRGRGRNGNTTS